jgi:hypothetical protein
MELKDLIIATPIASNMKPDDNKIKKISRTINGVSKMRDFCIRHLKFNDIVYQCEIYLDKDRVNIEGIRLEIVPEYSSTLYTYIPPVGVVIINTDKVSSNLEIKEYFENILLRFDVASNVRYADSDKIGVLNRIRLLYGYIAVTDSDIKIKFDKFNMSIELVDDDKWKVISPHLDEPVIKVTLFSAVNAIEDTISDRCTLLPNIL